MARAKVDPYAKRANENHFEWRARIARYEQNERDKDAPLVTPEAANHGDYQRDFVTDVDEGTKAWTVINRGGTPVARWRAKNQLSASQIAAIELCEKLWRTAWALPQLTAQYGERLPGSGNTELACLHQTDAREHLVKIESYFPGKTRDYWCVFENVVRHDMAAGVAGEAFGYSSRTAGDKAKTIVCFVADIIAAHERL